MSIKDDMQKAGWKKVPLNTPKGGTRAAVDEFIRQSKLTPLERMQEEWKKIKQVDKQNKK